MISIVSHKYHIELIENTFKYNSGIRGIINIDSHERTAVPIYIAGNTFTQNAGYIDATVLFIRARGGVSQDVYTLAPGNTNLFCTGYTFSRNTFTNNFGCS